MGEILALAFILIIGFSVGTILAVAGVVTFRLEHRQARSEGAGPCTRRFLTRLR